MTRVDSTSPPMCPSRRTPGREPRQRRATLLAMSVLLLLSTGPVFGHHLVANGDRLLAGIDHVGALCVAALHLLLTPVHETFHVAIVVGLAYAAWDRVRAWRRLRLTLGVVAAHLPVRGSRVWHGAERARLDPRRIRVVEGLPTPALTAGWLRPRVYVAASLEHRLNPDELAAVLSHERAHLTYRDPLRSSLLRALACTLFWLPALRRLADDMADEAEIRADDAAAEGHPLVLASALLAAAEWPERHGASLPSSGAAGIHRPDLLDRRIRRLVGEPTVAQSHVTGRSLLAAGVALALVWGSGLLMTHPLPDDAMHAQARHCEHPGELPLTHLFCLGSPFAAVAARCPHHAAR